MHIQIQQMSDFLDRYPLMKKLQNFIERSVKEVQKHVEEEMETNPSEDILEKYGVRKTMELNNLKEEDLFLPFPFEEEESTEK